VTSRERIIETAENLGLSALSGTGSPLDAWRDLRIELDTEHVLVVRFDGINRIIEAVIENEDGTRRAIRPANTLTVQNTMRDAYSKRARQKLDPAGMLTPKRLRKIGENALIEIQPSTSPDRDVSQRRIDHIASRILRTYIHITDDSNHSTYRPELIASAVQYNPHTTGAAEAAQVLAREAIRLAINARLAAQDRSSHIFPIVDLTGPGRDVIGDVERSYTPAVLTGPGMPDPEPIELPDWQAVAETERPVSQSDSCEVGPMSVDIHGPWDRPVFEVGRWDNEEGAFEHVVSLSREEADALHTALGRTLLG
jgi:hypothetical protein